MSRAANIDKCRMMTLFITIAIAFSARAHGVREFVHGHWFENGKFVDRTFVSVDGVFRDDYDGDVSETVDLQGGYVIPPFAEAHTHDFTMPDGGATSARYLKAGIFYAQNDNSIARLTEQVRPSLNHPETVDVIWANGGLTATGGHPVQIYDSVAGQIGWKPADMNGEAYWIVDTAADLERQWPAILARKPDFIKAYLDHSEEYAKRKSDAAFYGKRGLDPSLLPQIVKRAHDAKMKVVVHVTTAADYHAALSAGVDEIAHLPLEKITPADARLAASKHIRTVTTTLSHRPTTGITDLDGLHRANLVALRDAGAPIVFGTDSAHSVVDEIENVRRLGIFNDATLLRIAFDETARAIFPSRKIGRLADGYEASFLVLAGNPLTDFANIRKITMRVKTGHLLPPPTTPIAQRIADLAIAEGAPAAIAEYHRLRRDEAAKWDLSEPQLNAAGYTLLRMKHVDDAIAIFALNVEQFPESPNVYDSLGEALAAKGDVKHALDNYRKSLELNPHNDNARKAIEELERH